MCRYAESFPSSDLQGQYRKSHHMSRFLRPLLLNHSKYLLRCSRYPLMHHVRWMSTKDAAPVPPSKPETPVEAALREAKDNQVQEFLKGTVDVPQVVKKSIWSRVKDEAAHYWHGARLLGAETKISWRLLVKMLKGNQLSRREFRQVSGTLHS